MPCRRGGRSEHYCSFVKLGKKVPHPRHWKVLGELSNHLEPPSVDDPSVSAG
jgi:hypothetical protein